MKISFFLFVLLSYFNFTPHDLFAFIYPEETPIVKYLKPIEISEPISGLESVDCIYVINLDERPEKWIRMQEVLRNAGLKANRVSGVNGWKISEESRRELSGFYPIRMQKGHLGCLLSHVSAIKDAYERGFNQIWIMEDDAAFIEDIRQIPPLLKQLSEIDPNWDVFYTDIDSKNHEGIRVPSIDVDFHPDRNPPSKENLQKRTMVTEDIMRLGLRFGLYSYLISRQGIEKIVNYFTHVYLWTNIDIDIHYIPGIREYSTARDIVSVWFQCKISDTHYENP